jgi:hypothetical protein
LVERLYTKVGVTLVAGKDREGEDQNDVCCSACHSPLRDEWVGYEINALYQPRLLYAAWGNFSCTMR